MRKQEKKPEEMPGEKLTRSSDEIFSPEMRKVIRVTVLGGLGLWFLSIGVALFLFYPNDGRLLWLLTWLGPTDSYTTTESLVNGGAAWTQALIGLVGLSLGAFAVWQVVLMKKQNQQQQEMSEREAYLPLIRDGAPSIRRFLHAPLVRKEFSALDARLETLDTEDNDKYQNHLDDFRHYIDTIGKKIHLPVLDRDACLDDIESLLNEYNYLCKLINDRKLDVTFTTKLGLANFETIHDLAMPFIKLRRKKAPDYACHLIDYVENKRKKLLG